MCPKRRPPHSPGGALSIYSFNLNVFRKKKAFGQASAKLKKTIETNLPDIESQIPKRGILFILTGSNLSMLCEDVTKPTDVPIEQRRDIKTVTCVDVKRVQSRDSDGFMLNLRGYTISGVTAAQQ